MHVLTITRKSLKTHWGYVHAAAKSLQSCPTLCDPIDGSPPGSSPSLGFSRQEHWSGLPFPSPVYESEKWRWSRSVMSDSSQPHRLQPTRLLRPWDFPGKSTGVGCHCLWCTMLIFLFFLKIFFFLNFKVSPLPCHAVGPYSCKRVCGRTLTCQNHVCMKECHKVTETDSCTDKKKVMSLDWMYTWLWYA